MSSIEREFLVTEEDAGERFDKILARAWSEFSRSKIQNWIECGDVLLNGQRLSVKQKAKLGDRCVLRASLEPVGEWLPESMNLSVVFEDKHMIILNKPAGLVVHPAAGNWNGTLVNGLLHDYPELEALPRAGIVHRLDKDTTGVMVVARSLEAHHNLIKAMQARDIRREYQALIFGHLPQQELSVDKPLGRHPKNRLKMAVVANGKHAKTHFRVSQILGQFSLLDARLETGRTHQIRVHLSHLGLPIFGDQLYGHAQGQGVHQITLSRQALHARRLRLDHPINGKPMGFEAGLPIDFKDIVDQLQSMGDDVIL